MASKRKSLRRSARKPMHAKPRAHARRAVQAKRKPFSAGGMRTLYPPIDPYNSGMLRVATASEGGHELYFEESGNPNGKPVVFVHGGPGAGCDKRARQFFDPDAYRIVLFDQRGCGRSKPHASLVNNTTWDLVADMEKLRTHLGIDRWQVFGGSWGSTLGLAYTQTHPARVTELILRGIFLLRPWELHWFYQHGASALFPDRWRSYVAPIPQDERHDLIAAFYKRLTSTDRTVLLEAARAWSMWEAATCFIHTNDDMLAKWGADEFAVAVARIECHYFVHRGFLQHENQLLKNVERMRHIPGVIVQGRYDVICPMQTAWDLQIAWPEADFRIVPDAGHSAFEPGITHELVLATDRFR